jgi:hypothetical protein
MEVSVVNGVEPEFGVAAVSPRTGGKGENEAGGVRICASGEQGASPAIGERGHAKRHRGLPMA